MPLGGLERSFGEGLVVLECDLWEEMGRAGVSWGSLVGGQWDDGGHRWLFEGPGDPFGAP